MLRLFMLALACGSTLPDATNNSDFREWSGRIVGGTNAAAGQFPYVASLRSISFAHFCGATVFSPRWILSAAHCTIGRSGANIIVVVGTISRTTGGITHSVSRIINHPSYSSTTLANDVSVLETTTEVATTVNVAPAALSSVFLDGGVRVIATGWGQTTNPGPLASNLQWVFLTTLTNADCRSRFSAGNAARVFDNTICTFTQIGQGTCMGDSGSPIAIGNTVQGIVSWGVSCAVGSPDVYARVSSHRAWIQSVSGV